jgi:hypothetical protein
MPARVAPPASIVASAVALFAALLFASPLPAAAAATDAFDGTWFVSLDCPDTSDRNGLVKGYQYGFDVQIVHGHLDGMHGTAGQAASVHYVGDVADDGALEIRAEGMTGANDYSVGRVARGTAYRYTMGGRLDETRGQAVRRELRPCKAAFAKR